MAAIRPLFALVASVILVDTMFYSAIVPLLPDYAEELGLSKTAAGVLSASYAAGTLLAALPAGWLAARLGVRPVMLIGLGLFGSSSLVFAFAGEVTVLDLARFAQGVGGACAWTAGLAWLLAAAPGERRGELIGSVLAVAVSGLLLGPVVGAAATIAGPEVVFSGIAVLVAGLLAWVLATPGQAPSPVLGLRDVATRILTAPVLVAFWLVVLPSILAGVVDVLAPLRLDELGASGIVVGAVFLVAAAFEAIISPAIGRLSDRRGRPAPIRVGLLASTVAALLIPLPASIIVLAVGVVAVFLAMSFIWTPAMALLSERSEANGLDLAFATALVSLAWAGGQVLGGAAGPGIADAASDTAAYVAVAVLFAATVIGLALTRSRARVG